jgi:hypothetical protein
MRKWGPKLEKWNDIIDRIEFEEVIVDAPADLQLDSSKGTANEALFLKEPKAQEGVQTEKCATSMAEGGNTGDSSSSSEGGETDTSEGEGEEVDHADSNEQNDSDNDNEPARVVECDYKKSCAQVADYNESQKRKGGQQRSSHVQKKTETGSTSV